MTSTRKRRVTLVSAEQTSFDMPSINNATEGSCDDKLMTRASKRRKLALSNNPLTEETTETVKPTVGENTGVSKQTTRVKRQAWTSTGIGIFFEALAEHGKDFGKILNYMCAKEKKKRQQRDPFLENITKNQVRFFYYRTWHKVSSLLALGTRDGESPSRRKEQLQKVPTPLPSGSDVMKGCGHCVGSDEDTEGETEAVFDMSLDEGDDSQDGCTEQQVVVSTETADDGDSVPCGAHFSDPSPFSCDVIEPSSQLSDHLDADKDSYSAAEDPANFLIEEVTNDAPAVENDSGRCAHRVTSDSEDHHVVSEEGGAGKGAGPIEAASGKSERKKPEVGGSSGGGGAGGGTVKVNGVWQSLDLVAMICYSKLKQKCRADKETLGRKLNELVYNGTTTIRIKGKRKKEKMKIPNCPALKSSKNAISGESSVPVDSSPVETSSSLTLELQPLNSATWSYVQQLSMNPRLRLNLSPTKTVKELFQLIATKWHILSKEVFSVLRLFSLPSKHRLFPPTLESQQGHQKPLPLPTEQTSHEKDDVTLLKPLELEPSMTLGEVKAKYCVSKTKLSRLSFQYEISHSQQADTAERNLEQLMKLATVLSSLHKPASAAVPISPVTPPSLVSTPTNRLSVTPSNSTSSIISSPVVKQYIKNLPKKSPIKSPLAKYKRMKQLRPSPLKATARQSSSPRIKPIQLQFPPSQVTHSSQNTPMVTTPLINPSVSSLTLPIPPQSTVVKSKPQTTSKDKGKEQSKKTPHLVTLSKSCLTQSGSFTGLRLNDIFQSVNENFKGIQSMNKKSTKAQKGASIHVVPLPEDTKEEVAGPVEMSTGEAPEENPVTQTSCPVQPAVLPPRRGETPPPNLFKASPLEQLASQVSSKQQISGSAPLSTYQVNIVTTGVAMPAVTRPPTIASPTGRPTTTTTTSAKPVKRNPNFQRPVVPKPLVYLPQFTKQLASLHVPLPQQPPTNQQPTSTTTATLLSVNHAPSATTTAAGPSQPQASSLSSVSQLPRTALNTQELLQAQVSLLQDLFTKPASRNREDEQKRQQAVQTLLQSLLTLGAQYPALLQKLDLNALLSAAKSFGGKTESSSLRSQGLTSGSSVASENPIHDLSHKTNQLSPDSNAIDLPSHQGSTAVATMSIGSSHEPIFTCSDTVTELLKGLSPNNDDQAERESVIRLSEETADVLPNFARAMMHLRPDTTNPITSEPVPSDKVLFDSEKNLSSSTDSLAGMLQTDNQDFNDMSFKNVVDNTDYNEVFAQLKDILKTPERKSVSKSVSSHSNDTGDAVSDTMSSPTRNRSHAEFTDIFSSPFKAQQSSSSSSADHVGIRSLMEENSVDYINKFKELASAMNHIS